MHEGGISTPCIISWGNHVKNKGGLNHQPAQFSDIMSTCVELAGATYPKEYRKSDSAYGRSVYPSDCERKEDARKIYLCRA